MNVAKRLEECSGPWAGFWLQREQRGAMSLELKIAKGLLKGRGEDRIGTFQIKGEYHTAQVSLTKTYGRRKISYEGLWDGSMIFGKWTLETRTARDEGVFEIWPLSDDLGLEGLADPKRIKLLVGSTGQM